MKRCHRLVILPDYQGVGLGRIFLNEVAGLYKKNKYRFYLTTSQPALIYPLKNDENWKLKRIGRVSGHLSETSTVDLRKSSSIARLTTSWEYCS
jgi:GNAT superfamily N-acetyltransferase